LISNDIIDPSATANKQLFETYTAGQDRQKVLTRESKSMEPKVRHQNFLKKGDKSRVYDPKEVIKQHKKSQAE